MLGSDCTWIVIRFGDISLTDEVKIDFIFLPFAVRIFCFPSSSSISIFVHPLHISFFFPPANQLTIRRHPNRHHIRFGSILTSEGLWISHQCLLRFDLKPKVMVSHAINIIFIISVSFIRSTSDHSSEGIISLFSFLPVMQQTPFIHINSINLFHQF